ncbi:ABC transporter [Hyaloraphidium curvatum]|nr:ABC transporter [Hyaloraphidium curvatum]
MATLTLPMYDWPELHEATDLWIRGIARHLRRLHIEAPAGPTRPDYSDIESVWTDPELILSQTCGYPLTHALRDRVSFVAAPTYDADGCSVGRYSSIVLARRSNGATRLEDFRGRVAAVNNTDSMSGMLALKLVFGPLADRGRFFSRTVMTGGHLLSLAALNEGRADVAAVDAVCVALAVRHRPELLADLVEVARSPQVPSLPYITSLARSKDMVKIRQALDAAVDDPELADVRRQLLIAGFSDVEEADYSRILDLEREVEARGGLDLSTT